MNSLAMMKLLRNRLDYDQREKFKMIEEYLPVFDEAILEEISKAEDPNRLRERRKELERFHEEAILKKQKEEELAAKKIATPKKTPAKSSKPAASYTSLLKQPN